MWRYSGDRVEIQWRYHRIYRRYRISTIFPLVFLRITSICNDRNRGDESLKTLCLPCSRVFVPNLVSAVGFCCADFSIVRSWGVALEKLANLGEDIPNSSVKHFISTSFCVTSTVTSHQRNFSN